MICQLLKETIQNTVKTSDFKLAEIHGGFSKQVYKITTDNDSFILYIWRRPFENNLTENQTDGVEYLFPDGFAYFIHNTELLTGLGVRVPGVITAGHNDDGGFDYAIVEFLKGQSLQEYMNNGGKIKDVAGRIIEIIDRMAAEKRPFYGSPMVNEPYNLSATGLVFNFYAEELNIASKLDNEISLIQNEILHLLRQKMSEITEPNAREFSLIHGELTPPHVFILDNGQIGLIDIEGIKYFDTEYDWAVINSVYGEMVPLPGSLNLKKLEFYKLCLKVGHLSVAADYLTHVDCNDKWFINVREGNLHELKKML
ncbi:MAG TPA: aminoglycoside phosphotransferase family protein [Thermoclostridium sp.]